MTFQITKKDKILLGVLAVVLFAGLFFVYGILPVQDELDAVQNQITAKQKEVQELEDRLAAINMSQIDKKYDDLLELYYKSEQVLTDEMDRIETERIVTAMFEQYQLTGYSTVNWSLGDQKYTAKYEDITTEYYVKVLNVSTMLNSTDMAQVESFVDRVAEIPGMQIDGINLKPTTLEGGGVNYSIQITMRWIMQIDKAQGSIPVALPHCANVLANGNKIEFDSVANAIRYDFYVVTVNESGDKVFTLINNASLVSQNVQRLSQTITSAATGLAPGQYQIAVRAVGDKKQGYFKSLLNDETQIVTLNIA